MKYEIKLMLRPTPTHTRDLRMCGTHNGYLALPEGHPWFGMDYEKIPADVHGGLTYGKVENTLYSARSESPNEWVIGFDTCHWGDKPEVQDINFVWAELLRLHDQAQKATAGFCECGGGYCVGYCDFAMAEQEKYYDSVSSGEAPPTKQIRLNTLVVFNMVTCGNCGFPLLHKIDAEEITCPNCKYCSEPCDFPDATADYHTPKGNPIKLS